MNKEYPKEEYEKLRSQLIEHMKKNREWGEFFPISMSPFNYNETVAQEYFTLTKEKALSKKYTWKNQDKKEYLPQTFNVPQNINNIEENITKELLACNECKKNYRIIKQEFMFYKNMAVPIPEKCPDCRHKTRIKMRNPRKLWNRACQKCNEPIQTTYTSTRPEKVYCEKCYLEAVY